MATLMVHFASATTTDELIQIIAIVVALILGAGSAMLTWKLERNRLASHVVLEIDFKPIIILKTRNIGPTMATKIKINWLSGKDNLFPVGAANKLEPLHLTGREFNLVPGQELKAYLGTTQEVFDQSRTQNIYDFEISYADRYAWKRRKDRFTFDMSSFSGVAITTSDLEDISRSLSKIEKTLERQKFTGI